MSAVGYILIFFSWSVILEAVREKFPDYKRSIFGMAINNFLNDLRRKNNNAGDHEDVNSVIITTIFVFISIIY